MIPMLMSFKDSRIVYSTGLGQLCPNCRRPVKDCVCPRDAPGVARPSAVRVGRETKGRSGKGVTIVTGLGRRSSKSSAAAAERYATASSKSRASTATRSWRRWPGRALLPRSPAADRLSCPHRDKSCPERVLEIDENRRRRKRPTNAQAHERQSLAISGERPGTFQAHRRGTARPAARSISQVRRTEGRQDFPAVAWLRA